jgi:hypothetical protein
MNKITLALAIFCFIGTMILLSLPRKEPTLQEQVSQLKLKDFYLVYQYYFDPNLIELRKEIEHNEMVRNQKVGKNKRL